MKSKNQYITGTTEELQRLYDEYKNYCGRDVKLEDGRLVVFALPPVKPKRKKEDEQVSRPRRTGDDDTPTRSVGRREQRPKRD